MERIYAFGSHESLRQDIYLTQGVNETYGSFACRVSGVRLRFAEPDRFLRSISNESSDNAQGIFREHFGHASAASEYFSFPGEETAQRRDFHMRSEIIKHDFSRDNYRTGQASIEQPEIKSHVREASEKPTKIVLHRLLSFIIRCFIPCVNVKK